jgi:hypothetical protein
MSEKRIFEVGYVEYPKTSVYYRSVKIDVSNYPELEGKTDQEVIDYIQENAYQMKATEEFYDNLGEELSDQDVVREKIPHVDSEIWVEVSNGDKDEEDDEEGDD